MVNVCPKLEPRPVEERELKPPRAVIHAGKMYIYVYENSRFVCSYCGSVSAFHWADYLFDIHLLTSNRLSNVVPQITRSHESCGKHFKTCRVLHGPEEPLPAVDVPFGIETLPDDQGPSTTRKRKAEWIQPTTLSGDPCKKCKVNHYCHIHAKKFGPK
jgi:hypothetical protein